MKNNLAKSLGDFFKLHHKWVVVVFASLGTGLFAVLGTYYFQPSILGPEINKRVKAVIDENILGKEPSGQSSDQTNNGANNQSGAQSGSQSANQSTTTPIDTTNWQTYTNSELGYEVKYPEGYSVINTTQGIKFIRTDLKDIEIEYPFILTNGFINQTNDSLLDWVVKNSNLFIGEQDPNEVEGFTYPKELTINGLKAIELTWENMGTVKSTFIQKENKIFMLELNTLSTVESAKEVSDVYNIMVFSIQ